MREAKLILPVFPEALSCADGTDIHFKLATRLASTFGGYTATEGDGGWTDDSGRLISERVRVYVVAMQGDAGEAAALRNIARWLACDCQEDCVYIRYAGGEVELIAAD